MKVQIVYFDGCPSWQVAAQRLQTALEATGHGDARVELIEVSSPDEAAEARFAGSPTLLVEGRDLFPGAAPITQLACRVYPGPQGLSGSPTFEALVAALSDLSPDDATSIVPSTTQDVVPPGPRWPREQRAGASTAVTAVTANTRRTPAPRGA